MVRDRLISAGLAATDTEFLALRGGRTNRLWRYSHGGDDLVAKLFASGGTPLFPNDPLAETMALRHLRGSGLAPELVDLLYAGTDIILIYRHVAGPIWSGDAEAAGALMHRLHRTPPPPDLRQIPFGAKEILTQGDAMLGQSYGDAGRALARLRPTAPDIDTNPADLVFLHGDIVPSNMIQGPGGLCLIDWQCPAIGDATEDIAIFLSPAMQHLYGNRRMSRDDEVAFLAAYDHPARTQHYKILARAYHWRMAAYCLWKSAQGDPDYLAGYDLEISRLQLAI